MTEDVKKHKYEIGDKFSIEILELITDENGNPAYRTNYGAIREDDLETLPKVHKIEKSYDGVVTFQHDFMLIVTKAYDETYEEHIFFDNWLDAYKEMFNSIIEGFTATQVEQEMKSGRMKLSQYSAYVHRDEGKFIYRIVRLVDEEELVAEG